MDLLTGHLPEGGKRYTPAIREESTAEHRIFVGGKEGGRLHAPAQAEAVRTYSSPRTRGVSFPRPETPWAEPLN